jgi:hypothetical protein
MKTGRKNKCAGRIVDDTAVTSDGSIHQHDKLKYQGIIDNQKHRKKDQRTGKNKTNRKRNGDQNEHIISGKITNGAKKTPCDHTVKCDPGRKSAGKRPSNESAKESLDLGDKEKNETPSHTKENKLNPLGTKHSLRNEGSCEEKDNRDQVANRQTI